MITLNKIKFAESEKEMINSLFEGIATCSGYAKRLKHSIKLFNLQHELIDVINEHSQIKVIVMNTNMNVTKLKQAYTDYLKLAAYQGMNFMEYLLMEYNYEVKCSSTTVDATMVYNLVFNDLTYSLDEISL